uniref:Uncharacterized protein n=1 Tax=Arundo donax TaxID=35708 RepID=A0A0A9E4P7_ARUDO
MLRLYAANMILSTGPILCVELLGHLPRRATNIFFISTMCNIRCTLSITLPQ